MDFSLSSSLVGSAVSNPDKLALDLQFAADKTLTARKGPTPVFTRASSGRFVGSDGLIQSAGTNVARFDHDPVTLGCKGLLIEESRTNVALYSGAIVNNIGWTGSTTSSVSGTGPDGNSSYQLSETVITSIQSIANTGGTGALQTTSVVTGTTYTGSIFVKKVAESIDWIQMTFGGSGFGTMQYANFNIGNGTVGNSAGLASGTSPRIENYGNGWYRLSISVTASATLASNNVILAFIQNTNGTARIPIYLGSTSNSVLASLCQFETGAFPTSYIPTTTASVIRSADVCSITGSNFSGFYNQPECTVRANFIPLSIASPSSICGTNDPRDLELQMTGSGNIVGLSANQISGTSQLLRNGVSINTKHKFAFASQSGNQAVCLNGGTVLASPTWTKNTTSPTVFNIGKAGFGGQYSGIISELSVYKKRLSNAKLQALTV